MAQLEPKKISALSDEQKAALLEALGVQTVLPVLTEYPTTDATKAGTKFLYKGNEWHYMTQAEIDSCEWTGLVEVGFPAPVNKTVNSLILYNSDLYEHNSSLVPSPQEGYILDFLGVGLIHDIKRFNFATTSIPLPSSIKNAALLKNLEDNGTRESFKISAYLTAELINDFFTQLPTTTKTATLNVSGNPGAVTCDPTIATAKGYTVITS